MKLLGMAEIADELGVPYERVRKWKQRGYLPEPTAILKCGNVWLGRDIGWWIGRTRRELADEAAQAADAIKVKAGPA